MNKNDLRIVKTKQNIHKSLLKILKVKPLSHIKITELCKEAAINRGTFYFHYSEVGDVFQELYKEIMVDLKNSYDEPFKMGFDSDLKNLDPKTVKIFDHVKKYEDFYKVVLSEDVHLKYYYMLYDAIRALTGETRADNVDDRLHNLYHAHGANAIIGLIIEWYRNDFSLSVEEMNDILVKVVFNKHMM